MTRLMTEKELEAFEATRDIEAEILQGIDDMLANNAAKRTVITETDVALARRKAQLTQELTVFLILQVLLLAKATTSNVVKNLLLVQPILRN